MDHFSRGDLEKLKEYTDFAHDGVSNLQKFAKASRELEKEGKTLNALQEVASSLTQLSKVGAALGGAAAGLQLVLMFIPSEDKEQEILDGIGEIKAQIEGLKNTVTAGFKKLELGQSIATDEAVLIESISDIENAYRLIGQIAERRKAGEDPSDLIDNLMDGYSQTHFEAAITSISHVLTGTGGNASLLDAVYGRYHGDSDRVAEVAKYFVGSMHTAATVVGVMQTESVRRKANGAPDADLLAKQLKDAADRFEPDLKAGSDYAAKKMNDCLDPVKMQSNIINCFHDRESEMTLSQADYIATARSIVEVLQSNYSYLKFSAVAYKPVRGYNNHYYHWSDNEKYHVEKERPDETGKGINIVIFWSGRKTPEDRKIRLTHELVPNRDGPRNPPAYPGLAMVLEDLYGPPLEKTVKDAAGRDPQKVQKRVAWVMDLAQVLNRAKYHVDGTPKRLRLDRLAYPYIEDHYKDKAAGPKPSLVWCGKLKHDEFAVASSNDACLMTTGKHFLTSEHDPHIERYRNQATGESFGDNYNKFPRVAAFWGDA